MARDGTEHSQQSSPTTPPTWWGLTPYPGPQLRGRAGAHGRTSTPWALLSAKELGCGLDDFTGARVACSAGRALEHTTGE